MQLVGFTKRPRHEATFDLKETILRSGGAVLDFQMFSNRVLRLTIEVQAARLDALVEGIERAGISLAPERLTDALPEARAVDPDDTLVGTLVIEFASDEPDLRREIPAIPG